MISDMVLMKYRREAEFHVQIRLQSFPTDFHPEAVEHVRVAGRVVRIFRGDFGLSIGSFVEFDVLVAGESSPDYMGATKALDYAELLQKKYVEVFLSRSQSVYSAYSTTGGELLLDAPTYEPMMSGRYDEPNVE